MLLIYNAFNNNLPFRKRARSKKRPRESLGGGAAGGLSTISANIESGNYRCVFCHIDYICRPDV